MIKCSRCDKEGPHPTVECLRSQLAMIREKCEGLEAEIKSADHLCEVTQQGGWQWIIENARRDYLELRNASRSGQSMWKITDTLLATCSGSNNDT